MAYITEKNEHNTFSLKDLFTVLKKILSIQESSTKTAKKTKIPFRKAVLNRTKMIQIIVDLGLKHEYKQDLGHLNMNIRSKPICAEKLQNMYQAAGNLLQRHGVQQNRPLLEKLGQKLMEIAVEKPSMYTTALPFFGIKTPANKDFYNFIRANNRI